jgi:hypothetical protein
MKMIGVRSERGRFRMSEAVSKPSMPGMETSRRMTAKSCFNNWRSAECAEPRSAAAAMHQQLRNLRALRLIRCPGRMELDRAYNTFGSAGHEEDGIGDGLQKWSCATSLRRAPA